MTRDPGWGQSLSIRRAHYVPHWTPREWHYGRETGLGLCGFPGLIDKQGLEDGARLPRCSACVRQRKPHTTVGDLP